MLGGVRLNLARQGKEWRMLITIIKIWLVIILISVGVFWWHLRKAGLEEIYDQKN